MCGQYFSINANREYFANPDSSCDLNVSASIDLTAPIDVYYDWVDACEAVEQQHQEEMAAARAAGGTAASKTPAAAEEGAADNFIVDDEMDAEAVYDDEE